MLEPLGQLHQGLAVSGGRGHRGQMLSQVLLPIRERSRHPLQLRHLSPNLPQVLRHHLLNMLLGVARRSLAVDLLLEGLHLRGQPFQLGGAGRGCRGGHAAHCTDRNFGQRLLQTGLLAGNVFDMIHQLAKFGLGHQAGDRLHHLSQLGPKAIGTGPMGEILPAALHLTHGILDLGD